MSQQQQQKTIINISNIKEYDREGKLNGKKRRLSLSAEEAKKLINEINNEAPKSQENGQSGIFLDLNTQTVTTKNGKQFEGGFLTVNSKKPPKQNNSGQQQGQFVSKEDVQNNIEQAFGGAKF